jgi:Carboxypeptidase regulatory-like domain
VTALRLTAVAVGWCLIAVVSPAAQRAKEKTEPEGFRISGVVVDAISAAAVGGAELWTTGDAELKTTADGEGRFVFEGVEPGKYPLYATAPGYVTQGYNQHGSFFTGIAVGSEANSEHLVFRLARQAVIYGRVTDERGDAVRQATTMLFAEDLRLGRHGVEVRMQVQTNDEGAYRFAHLLPGKYYVGVMARPWYAENGMKYQPKGDGGDPKASSVPQLAASQTDPMFDVVYPFTFFAAATQAEAAVPLVVQAGDEIEANMRLIAVPSIHMLLTGMDDRKRKSSNVSVVGVQKPFDATGLPLNVNSAEIAPGVYEVAGLPPGEVRLMVNREGDEAWAAHGIRLNAVDGESVDGNSRLATSTVSGTVVPMDGNKSEIQGEVFLRKGDEQSASTKLRKDGSFSFSAVEEGTYEVQVNTQGNAEYVAKVTASGAKASGKTVKIEGASEVRLVVTMARGLGRVTGIVRMDDQPRAGVLVLLVPEAENLPEAEFEESVRMDQSDSDGTFALGGIVPGKYVLVAIEDGWDLEWREEGVLKSYREQGIKVEVGAAEEKKVTVTGTRKKQAFNSEKVKK